MSFHEEILAKENQSWEALKKSGKSLEPFLAEDCMMLFPGGMIFDKNSDPSLNSILAREDVKPWTSFKFTDVHTIPIGQDGAVISYVVEAHRDEEQYNALISTVWRKHEGDWKMCLHQQTPMGI